MIPNFFCYYAWNRPTFDLAAHNRIYTNTLNSMPWIHPMSPRWASPHDSLIVSNANRKSYGHTSIEANRLALSKTKLAIFFTSNTHAILNKYLYDTNKVSCKTSQTLYFVSSYSIYTIQSLWKIYHTSFILQQLGWTCLC